MDSSNENTRGDDNASASRLPEDVNHFIFLRIWTFKFIINVLELNSIQWVLAKTMAVHTSWFGPRSSGPRAV